MRHPFRLIVLGVTFEVAVIWLLLNMVGCTPRTNMNTFERTAVHAAITGWVAAGLPRIPERCELQNSQIRRTSSVEEWFAICRNAQGSAACSRMLGRPRAAYAEIILMPGQPVTADGEPVIHEMLHRTTECVGWPRDYDHKDPRVWLASEKIPGASAQSHARKLMLEGVRTW